MMVPPNKIGKAPQANPAKMADVAFEWGGSFLAISSSSWENSSRVYSLRNAVQVKTLMEEIISILAPKYWTFLKDVKQSSGL